MKNMNTENNSNLNQFIQQVASEHHPVTVHATDTDATAILVNQEDWATAQAIIRASIGRDVPYLMA